MTDRPRSQAFTVNVDAMRCGRFGFCEHEAPEVFRLRSDGRLSYRGSVPMDQMANVMRAVEVCPARAIGLNQVPTKVFTPRQADTGVNPVSGPAGLIDTGRHRVIGLRERRPVRRGGRG